DHIDYDGFGNITNETSPSNGDRYKWTGREFDSETALQYNRARYLSSSSGAWTSQDPMSFAGGDCNLYRYVGNSTPLLRDSSGLEASPCSGGAQDKPKPSDDKWDDWIRIEKALWVRIN